MRICCLKFELYEDGSGRRKSSDGEGGPPNYIENRDQFTDVFTALGRINTD